MKFSLKSALLCVGLMAGVMPMCISPVFAATAGAATIQENTNYRVLPKQLVPQAQVEVIEFFSYGCPHCAHLEPFLQAWKKTLSPSVKFRRVPVVFRPEWENLAKVYYTLDALGVPNLESAVFQAIQKDNQNLADKAVFMGWLARQKVDVKKAQSIYDSFSINTRLMKGKTLAQEYRVEGVPLLIVGGRYLTDVQMAGGPEKLGGVLNHLIGLAQKDLLNRK